VRALSWPAGLAERVERSSPARLRVLIGLIVTVVMMGLVAHGNFAGSGDALHYMVIARSVAFDHDFDLANDYSDPTGIIQESPGDHARIGRNGVLRPAHDVGWPVVAAPFFAAAYRLAELTDRLPASLRQRAKLDKFIALRQLVSLGMIVVTAVLAIVFFDVSWRTTGLKTLAFAWTLVWALSPPVLSHGYVFFTEVPSALLALFVYAHRDAVLGTRPQRAGLALGLLTALLLLVHARNIGLVLALVLIVAWRVRRDAARGIGYAAGLILMGGVRIALNLRFWGTIVTSPHEHAGAWPGTLAFLSESALRGLGLLFDGRHGLLLSGPVYLLVPAAWWLLRRRSRAVSTELLLIAGAYLVFVLMPMTNTHGWRGGWSPAARFLVPIAPFLALAGPLVLAERASRYLTIAILALQFAIDAFFWGRPMLLWSEGPGPAPLLEHLLGTPIAARLPAWEHFDRGVLLASLIGLVTWASLTWICLRRPALPQRRRA
jgi:hypothetical protein